MSPSLRKTTLFRVGCVANWSIAGFAAAVNKTDYGRTWKKTFQIYFFIGMTEGS